MTFLRLPRTGQDNLRRDALAYYLASCTSLRNIDLSGTTITDAGLAHFTALSNLTELYLERIGVSDDSLQRLAPRQFYSLSTVSLGGTKATPLGPMSVRRAHPMCKFIAFRAPGPNQLDGRFGKKPKVFPSTPTLRRRAMNKEVGTGFSDIEFERLPGECAVTVGYLGALI